MGNKGKNMSALTSVVEVSQDDEDIVQLKRTSTRLRRLFVEEMGPNETINDEQGNTIRVIDLLNSSLRFATLEPSTE